MRRSFQAGGGTIHCFHESRALNGYLKGGVLYLIQVLNNTVYYLIFQFLQFYVGLCLVLIFNFNFSYHVYYL
jgi:hypothetical protein